MREKAIEQQLRTTVKGMGGIALKFVSPGMSGVPDRLVLLPGKRLAFVEVKAPGMQMRPLQVKRKRQMEALGFSVYVLDDVAQIQQILKDMSGEAI